MRPLQLPQDLSRAESEAWWVSGLQRCQADEVVSRPGLTRNYIRPKVENATAVNLFQVGFLQLDLAMMMFIVIAVALLPTKILPDGAECTLSTNKTGPKGPHASSIHKELPV